MSPSEEVHPPEPEKRETPAYAGRNAVIGCSCQAGSGRQPDGRDTPAEPAAEMADYILARFMTGESGLQNAALAGV